jgi:hypothetical protein
MEIVRTAGLGLVAYYIQYYNKPTSENRRGRGPDGGGQNSYAPAPPAAGTSRASLMRRRRRISAARWRWPKSFECPIHDHEEALATLRAIDFGPKDEVNTGAAVRIDGQWFVVSVATDAFECSGRTFMGISPEAPIYAAIAGASAGDVVDFRGRRLKVEAVE